MKLLLDTHVVLWWFDGDPKLSVRVRQALADATNGFLLTSVVAIEIATKTRIGKLKLSISPQELMQRAMQRFSAAELPLTIRHAVQLDTLPLHHRDPFDRLLVAQAQAEGATIVSQDQLLSSYGIPIIG